MANGKLKAIYCSRCCSTLDSDGVCTWWRCEMQGIKPETTFEIDSEGKRVYMRDLEKHINGLEKRLKDEQDAHKEDLELYGISLEALKQIQDVMMQTKRELSKKSGIETPETLNEWRDAAHNLSRAKGWYDDATGDDFVTKLALMHSEISEALEDFRNGHQINEVYYEEKADGSKKPCGVPIELADVAIRLFDMCGNWGIDLEAAVREKHEYNKTRPYRHGGKKV